MRLLEDAVILETLPPARRSSSQPPLPFTQAMKFTSVALGLVIAIFSTSVSAVAVLAERDSDVGTSKTESLYVTLETDGCSTPKFEQVQPMPPTNLPSTAICLNDNGYNRKPCPHFHRREVIFLS